MTWLVWEVNFLLWEPLFQKKKHDEKIHFLLNQETRFPLIMIPVAPHSVSENPSFYVEFLLCLFSQFKK